ncbi:MAG: hypothetical protein WAN47_02540 [Nitrosotalea sp.]
MAHGIADNLMMLVMSVAMLTMVISMLIMGVYWAFALLVLSGVLTAVATVFYSFQSARCMCGTNSSTQCPHCERPFESNPKQSVKA